MDRQARIIATIAVAVATIAVVIATVTAIAVR